MVLFGEYQFPDTGNCMGYWQHEELLHYTDAYTLAPARAHSLTEHQEGLDDIYVNYVQHLKERQQTA